MDTSYLVLNRKLGESISFIVEDSNGSKTVVNIDLHRKKGRMGIRAPRNVKVLRQELYNASVHNYEAMNQ